MASEVPAIIRWDQAYNRNGDEKLPRAAINVIRTYVNNNTLIGWVKGETLAGATGLSVRQIRRHIATNVEAGWLEILESGNSSGMANTYRLTFPKDDIDVTFCSAKGDTDVTQRVTSMTGKGDVDVTPTTPRTSEITTPRTTPEKDDIHVVIPDPWGSGISFPPNATSKWKEDIDVTLSIDDTDLGLTGEEQAEILEEFWAERLAEENTPEQKLIAALRDGPIRATTAQGIAGVGREEIDRVVHGLVDRGVVVHDRGAGTLSLA